MLTELSIFVDPFASQSPSITHGRGKFLPVVRRTKDAVTIRFNIHVRLRTVKSIADLR